MKGNDKARWEHFSICAPQKEQLNEKPVLRKSGLTVTSHKPTCQDRRNAHTYSDNQFPSRVLNGNFVTDSGDSEVVAALERKPLT